jgi:hypothetical protein
MHLDCSWLDVAEDNFLSWYDYIGSTKKDHGDGRFGNSENMAEMGYKI